MTKGSTEKSGCSFEYGMKTLFYILRSTLSSIETIEKSKSYRYYLRLEININLHLYLHSYWLEAFNASPCYKKSYCIQNREHNSKPVSKSSRYVSISEYVYVLTINLMKHLTLHH